MADSKITALTSISTSTDPANDPLVIVDVSDTSMAATGTTKKVTLNQLLGASGTATLASATITGDLTVDTSTLKVDSANDVVGVGTASPNGWGAKFVSLRSTTGISYTGVWNDGTNNPRLEISHTSTGTVLNATSSSGGAYSRLRLQAAGADQYQIDPLGIFTWYDGAGGTRMTLNATGLGVGGSPAFRLDVQGNVAGAVYGSIANNNTGGSGSARFRVFNSGDVSDGFAIINNYGASGQVNLLNYKASSLALWTNSLERLTIDSSGNVGIGVTPSAKLHVSGGNALLDASSASFPNRLVLRNTDTGGYGVRQTFSVYDYTNSAQFETVVLESVYGGATDGGSLTFKGKKVSTSSEVSILTIRGSGDVIFTPPATPPTLGVNGQLVINATSNTNLRFSYRGSDGVTRVANITLA